MQFEFPGKKEGHSYIMDFLLGLSDEAYLKVMSKLRDMQGVDLRILYADRRLKKVREGVWYVRVKVNKICYRFLGRLDGLKFAGVHAFIKKTDTIPPGEIETAEARLSRINI